MDYVAVGVIVTYLVTVTVVGSLLARRTSSSKDWAVAGGGMSMIMVAVGVAGTRIGGAGTYGVAGNVMSGGVWYLWWYGINTFLALALVGIFFAIPFRRLGLQTVGELFKIRFGTSRNQVLTSLCVQTEYFIVNIIEAYVIGVMLRSLLGIHMLPAVLIAAAVLISYTTLGGLWGAAVTNFIHCIVILVGLLAVGLIGINQAGGWEAITAQVDAHLASAGKDSEAWWSFAGAGWGAVLGMFFSAAVHTPAASVYTNFATAARSEKIIIPAFLLAGVIAACMPILAGLIGIETLAAYGFDEGIRGYVNITRLPTEISPWIGGAALAAILAAVISSGGPILLSSATMFVRDWMPFTDHYEADRKLRTYRITTVCYGLISAIAAWLVSMTTVSILDMLLFGFAMVVPPAIAVGYVIYWKGTTDAGAFWGMALGFGGGLIWFLLIKWAGWVEFSAPEGATMIRRAIHFCFVNRGRGVDPSYVTTLIPLLVVPIVSKMTKANPEGKERFYALVSGEERLESA